MTSMKNLNVWYTGYPASQLATDTHMIPYYMSLSTALEMPGTDRSTGLTGWCVTRARAPRGTARAIYELWHKVVAPGAPR